MLLTFSSEIGAADPETRTITGLIVPWDRPGNTSAGAVKFAMGSLQLPEDPSSVKLLLEHHADRPIGRAVEFTPNPAGIMAKFKIAKTTAGDDLLIEAAEGLRDGLSVGAQIDSHDVLDGVIVVKAARLIEVSAVAQPAFADARIAEVAASEAAAEPEPEQPLAAPNITESEPMEEIKPIEAEEQTVTAAAPIYTAPRVPNADELTLAVVRAARGDMRSAQLVTAALDGATTVTAPGVVPVTYLRDVVDVIDSSRPFISSIRRAALPAAGTSFKKPRWSSYPEVAEHTEGAAVATNSALIESLDIEVMPRMGGNKLSIELLDRSDPSYFAELRIKLADAYAINTESSAIGAFIADAQAAAGATAYAKIIDGIAKVYDGIKRRPNRLLVAVDAWADLMAVVDGSGRPLFAPLGATNSPGTLSPFAGSIMGLDVVVSHQAPAGTCIVYSDQSAVYYEAPGSPAVLQATQVSTAELEVAVKGYDALSLDFAFTVAGVTTNLGAAAITL